MAVIADVELRAGFQVRVRWYAQATQRYPANENEYYSTFFDTLEPNTDFNLSDPRFVLSNINDDPANLQYIIRDVCYTETLVPQFVDFTYFNPDYITFGALAERVDGGSTTIELQAYPDTNFNSFTVATGNRIQIGPIQSDVYEIADVTGTTITLTTATTKTFFNGTFVNFANAVDNVPGAFPPASTTDVIEYVDDTYPDRVAETALARIFDNSGSTISDPVQVTTPLYFDIGETVRRFYYDAALQTPFDGSLASGSTTPIISPDPRDLSRTVRGAWWATGDTDNEAAEEACLIDDQGYLIGKRDRNHGFEQLLYYGTKETVACTSTEEPVVFLANHPDFTDTGFTSIRNDDGASSLPRAGYYAWADPTIVINDEFITLYWGDNQVYPGLSLPDTSDLRPTITFRGILNGTAILFTIPASSTNQNTENSGINDRWEVDIDVANLRTAAEETPVSDVGFLIGITTDDTHTSTNRFVRFWDGAAFDEQLGDGVSLVDNCPTPLSNSVAATVHSSQQHAACNASGTSYNLFYTTTSISDFTFRSGNVTGVWTDQFGPNSDEPSNLGTSHIRYNDEVFLWTGQSLSSDNAPCTSLYCGDPTAGNTMFVEGGIRDDASQCIYPRRICTDPSALPSSYVPPEQRTPYDTPDSSACRYPDPMVGVLNLIRVGNEITGGSENSAYIVSTNAGTYLAGTSVTPSVTVTATATHEFTSGPFVSINPSGAQNIQNNVTVNVQYTISGTVAAIEFPAPTSQTFVYGASQAQACDVFTTTFETLYWGAGVTLAVGVSVFSNEGLTSPGRTGWYTVGSGVTGSVMYVSGGVVQQGFQSCVVAPPPEPPPFTAPSFSGGITPFGTKTSPVEINGITPFSINFTDPDDLLVSINWTLGNSQGLNLTEIPIADGESTVEVENTGALGLNSTSLIAQINYRNPNTGTTVAGETSRTAIIAAGGGIF